jgi:hypothetical protein
MVAVFELSRVALPWLGDAVVGVGEPDRTIARDDDVVGRIEACPVPRRHDGCDDTVHIPLDLASTVGTLDDRAVVIEGAAVREFDVGLIDRHLLQLERIFEDLVSRDVAPPHASAGGDPHGAFRPHPARRQAGNRCGRVDETGESNNRAL